MGERRRYLEKSRVVRVAVVAGVSLISITVMAILGASEWFYMLSVFTNHFMLGVFMASVVNENGYGTLDSNGRRIVDWDSKTGIFEGCMMVVSIATAYIQASVNWKNTSIVGGLLLLLIPLALELPMVIWLCRHWPENVERAICYEKAKKLCEERE